jgi:hydrogenase nickel incorporation protein HypA/HybF
MHEMSIALEVVEQVAQTARSHGADGVESVRLRIGELAGVVADALDFGFSLVCEGTVLEGARLETEFVAGLARCTACETRWPTGMPPNLCCPRCGGSAVELLAGRELQIVAVRWAQCPAHAPTYEER